MVKKKGEEYKCDECGLVVLVENPCGCDETCELVCCAQPMKQVKAPAKIPVSKAAAKAPEKTLDIVIRNRSSYCLMEIFLSFIS